MYKKINHLLILSIVLTQGCILEEADVFEAGESCDAQYVQKNDGECIKGECPEYDSYLSKGLCPKDYAKCYVDDGGVFYCADQCPANAHDYEYEDGGEKRLVCELDSYEHCGAHDLNCLTEEGNGGWYTAECDENKKCQVTECKDGYTLDHETCLNSKQCCGSDCKDCTRVNMMCSKGECVANCPNDSDIRCDGSCLDPMTSKTYCGSDVNCTPNECKPDQECRNGVCNCPGHDELCGEKCVDIQTDMHHCGNCETECETAEGWLDGRCEAGYCQAEECLEGYHFHTEKSEDGETDIVSCMEDSLVSCGNDEIDCTSLPGWSDGECRNAVCVPNACTEGFFLFEEQCEANSDIQCGSKDTICDAETEECDTTTAECVCKEGLTRCNGICVDLKSDPNYCGTCDTKCSVAHAQNACVEGACQFTCDDGYTDCGNVCYHLSDDVAHCGSCTNQCTTDVANAGPKCTAGSCDFECNQGYDRCSNGCTDILTDTNHCGACDHKCDVANAQNSCSGGSCTFQCNSGFVPNTAQTGCEAYVCTANTTRCNGLTFQTCETNKWGKDIPCTTTISNASATCNDNTGCGYKCNGSSTYCAGSNACKDLSTDADNCGKCDAKCNIANAHDIGCSGGKCTFTCNDRYVKNSAGTGCELYVCTHGAKQCSGLNYQTCDHNKWVTSVTCNVPSNGTAGCNDSTGCYKLCNGGYILCGDNCAGASGKTGIVNKSATIYTNAGSGNIGSLGYLDLYAVYGQYNGFYALNISGQKRYISTGDMYILPAKGKVDTSDDHGINVRTGPGTGYGKVGDGIAENDIVTIDGYTSDNKPSGCSYGWFHITSPLKGYAAADYVVLQSGAGGPSTSCP